MPMSLGKELLFGIVWFAVLGLCWFIVWIVHELKNHDGKI